MVLEPFQIFLIVALLLIVPLGFWNMKRMQKKKQEEEDLMYSQASQNSIPSTQSISPQEQTAKEYIESYKSQYPRESIKTALINSGNSSEDVDAWLTKYF